MDPEKARILFDQGGLFLLIDFPEGSEFGIDYNSWQTGLRFKGIKMIPPGIHFIYYSSVNKEGTVGPRSGFFYDFSAKEFVVGRWDKVKEEINFNSVTNDEFQSYQSNKEDLDKFLAAYPYEKYKQWISLSSHITKDLVNLLNPDIGIIHSFNQFESEASTTQSRQEEAVKITEKSIESEEAKQKRKLPKLKALQGTSIKYTIIPKKKYPEGSTPEIISKYNMDSSYALEFVLAERFEGDIYKLLGEIQYAFVCFFIGQNYDSFEQWKKLVHLLCTSSDAILKYPNAYMDFITVIHFQIREIPSDFFVDIVTCHNFLTVTLHELFQNLLSDNVDSKLKKKGINFQKHLTEKFHWDFSLEPDDYAPVVVDM
ncbi:a1-alpha2 repression [Bulinus truncatus]|nr:a1-alpha2 repression [Bulinus truncatus]